MVILLIILIVHCLHVLFFSITPSPIAITLLNKIQASFLSLNGFPLPKGERRSAVPSIQVGLECVFLLTPLPHKSGQKSLRASFVFEQSFSNLGKREEMGSIARSSKMGWRKVIGQMDHCRIFNIQRVSFLLILGSWSTLRLEAGQKHFLKRHSSSISPPHLLRLHRNCRFQSALSSVAL